MRAAEIIVSCYFVIGLILTFICWNKEYKYTSEHRKEIGEAEETNPILLLIGLLLFWPIKLVKDWFINFIE